MRHIANATYMSLDGVVQHPELWTFDYRSDDAAQVSHDQLFAADALIMGRHTYDIFAGHWPAATDPGGFADRMNTIPKYVLSRTLSQPPFPSHIGYWRARMSNARMTASGFKIAATSAAGTRRGPRSWRRHPDPLRYAAAGCTSRCDRSAIGTRS